MDDTETATAKSLYQQAIKGVRKIRDIEILNSEIERLISGSQKLDSTTVNVVSAKIQELAEQSGNAPHWCIMSSWLGPLVSGKSKEGSPGVGTILGHVLAAIPDGQTATLLAKTLWMIPLCSLKKPEHWVLAWIDFRNHEIGIFDSIPELGSSSWAEPVSSQILDKIYITLKQPLTSWSDSQWRRVLHSPAPLRCQMDAWSCGLFVLMAVEAVGNEEEIQDVVGNHKVEEAHSDVEFIERDGVFEALSTSAASRNDGESHLPGCDALINVDFDGDRQVETITEVRMKEEQERRVEMGEVGGAKEGMTMQLELTHNSEYEDNGLSDRENKISRVSSSSSTIPPAAKLPRIHSSGTSTSARRALLDQDVWVDSMSLGESSLKCLGCRKSIQLSKRKNRPYETKNWLVHKARCSQITGLSVVRARKLKAIPVIPKAGTNSIMGYFGRPSQSSSQNLVPNESAMLDTEGASAATLEAQDTSTPINPTPERVEYTTKTVRATTSVALIFAKAPQGLLTRPQERKPPAPAPVFLCKHLSGPEYDDYIQLIRTRSYGGISPTFTARVARQLFPYKLFPPLKINEKYPFLPKIAHSNNMVPDDGNSEVETNNWTAVEYHKIETILGSWSRWTVDYLNGYVKSTHCEEKTTNSNGICTGCHEVMADESFKRSVRRKRQEARLPAEERSEIFDRRQRFAARDRVKGIESKAFEAKLKDPVIFDIYNSLKSGNPEDCFLKLYQAAREGKLKGYERFTDVCEVLEDRIRRENSANPNAKYGIRYSETYLNFMIIMRGHGQNSNRQYEIYSGAFGGPSVRHLRTLVTKSADAFKNPALIFENVARVKRYVDSVNYHGPIIIGSDNTKVRKRLNFSTEHGAHVLGTTFKLDEVEVDDADDITEIVERTIKQNAFATQARAIIAKIPLPRCPPILISILPTGGNENANEIHTQHLKLQQMAAQLNLPLVALAADGASSELSAQSLMDQEQSQLPPLSYDYPLYGIYLKAPVFERTGPLISVTDPPHARKTCRNQPQYGTHTASLGVGYLVNQSLVDVYNTPSRGGLIYRDVSNVDKQDDGAARRMFHYDALLATTEVTGEESESVPMVRSIRPGFEGLFCYLFVMGSLFEAWMSPSLSVSERVLAAFRARFWLNNWRQHIQLLCVRFPDLYSMARSFISPSSFNIFNRLCDSLVLLALAYAKYYPDQPFCIWLIEEGFVEHFFGLSRQVLPNFSYAEFIKIAQHIMVRQRILESGLLKFGKRERTSAVGYIYNDDTDMRTSTDENTVPPSHITTLDLNHLVEVGHMEALRICRDILQINVPHVTAAKPVILHALGASTRAPKIHSTDNTDRSNIHYETEFDGEDSDDDEVATLPASDTLKSPTSAIDDCTAEASRDAAQYAALCKDLESVLIDHNLANEDFTIPAPINLPSLRISELTGPLSILAKSAGFPSKLLDISAPSPKITASLLLQARKSCQSGTGVKSERTVSVGPKYTALDKVREAEEDERVPSKVHELKANEASHRLRIAQDTNTEIKKQEQKKTRQIRWQNVAIQLEKELRRSAQAIPHLSERNVTPLNELKRHSYLIMRTEKRYYIGEVLDIYKKVKVRDMDQLTAQAP
ncbi:hypothetical protein BJ912DRAFT_900722 [Pholiota molesta]|nr:hypothetical protein BJ912DRAFT_900722 [Pholiota molesta]